MPKFSDDWRTAIIARSKVSMPDKVKPATLVAVAMAWIHHGDDDGRDIQAGGDSIGSETLTSPATARRVRRWLKDEGFGHTESPAVQLKKAEWWHAAIPGRACSVCAATPDPSEGLGVHVDLPIPLKDWESVSHVDLTVGEPATPDPSPDPSPDPPGGIATRNPEEQPSNEEEVMRMGDFERAERARVGPASGVPCEWRDCNMNLSPEYVAAGKTIHDPCARERARDLRQSA